MIVTAIFFIIKGVLLVLEGLLPSWTPVDFAGMADTVFSGLPDGTAVYFRWGDFYLPVAETVVAVGVLVTSYGAFYVYRAVKAVLEALHILGRTG